MRLRFFLACSVDDYPGPAYMSAKLGVLLVHSIGDRLTLASDGIDTYGRVVLLNHRHPAQHPPPRALQMPPAGRRDEIREKTELVLPLRTVPTRRKLVAVPLMVNDGRDSLLRSLLAGGRCLHTDTRQALAGFSVAALREDLSLWFENHVG